MVSKSILKRIWPCCFPNELSAHASGDQTSKDGARKAANQARAATTTGGVEGKGALAQGERNGTNGTSQLWTSSIRQDDSAEAVSTREPKAILEGIRQAEGVVSAVNQRALQFGSVLLLN
jgi:hypothetical protein